MGKRFLETGFWATGVDRGVCVCVCGGGDLGHFHILCFLFCFTHTSDVCVCVCVCVSTRVYLWERTCTVTAYMKKFKSSD